MNGDITTKTTGRARIGAAPLAAALLLALAILPARDVRAQDYRAVDRDVLLGRFHRDLSDALDGASQHGHGYSLEPGSVRLSYPESSGWSAAAFTFVCASAVYGAVVPAAATAFTASSSVPAGFTAAAKTMSFGKFVNFFGGLLGVFLYPGFSISNTLDAVDPEVLSERNIRRLAYREPELMSHLAWPLRFFLNRMEVHYTLSDSSGESEEGSCLAFFALERNPDGSHDLRYELDACSHDEIFPQTVSTWIGDPRIGSDGVDVWDRVLGQTRVVAKGVITIF